MLKRPDLAGLALAGIVAVCVTVLAVLSVPVPEILTTIALVALGVAGGAALPRGTAEPAPAPAVTVTPTLIPGTTLPALPGQPAYDQHRPPAAALQDDPQTGVFARVVRG